MKRSVTEKGEHVWGPIRPVRIIQQPALIHDKPTAESPRMAGKEKYMIHEIHNVARERAIATRTDLEAFRRSNQKRAWIGAASTRR